MVFTPYSTISPFIRGMPKWVPENDQLRIASYDTYERIYWNVPEAFALLKRGAEENPIYIPNARTIADTTAHFWLKGLTVGLTDPEANVEANAALQALLRRERFFSKFQVAKHSGVVRGDFVLHLTADPLKPADSRISINSVDPAAYFPVEDDDDLDRIIAVHLAEQFINADGDTQVKKLTYRYEGEEGTRRVLRSEAIYDLDDWAEPSAAPVEVIHNEEPLPDTITHIPVYHFKNMDWQGQPFGSSELRGFEVLLGRINQSISDEDLALALEGLGVYATDAPPPTDEDGNEVPWEISPGRVLGIPDGKSFNRVPGVGAVTPMLDHVHYLEEKLFEASGTTEVARGAVDVQAAESGIALAIKFIPTLAKIETRDVSALDVLTNFFYDWKSWHRAYEGPDFRELEILPQIGPKLPVNRDAVRTELNDMLDRKVISRAFYRAQMTALFDYHFPEEIEDDIVREESKLVESLDMMGARISQDLTEGENAGTGAVG